MKESEFSDYMKNRYQNQVDWYDSKAKKNKLLYLGFQITVIILSWLTPLLILLAPEFWRFIPIIMSVLVAVLSTTVATFMFYRNWRNYRSTCETLKREKYYYTFGIGQYKDNEKKEALFVERVESIMGKELTRWVSSMEREERQQT